MKWINSSIWLLVWYLISYIWRKTETLRKLTETCGKENVSVFLKLSPSGFSWLNLCGNFSVCFRTAKTRLKLTHQVFADRNLTKSNWNYTIVSSMLKLYRKRQLKVSIQFQQCFISFTETVFFIQCRKFWFNVFHVDIFYIACREKKFLSSFDLRKSSICVFFFK